MNRRRFLSWIGRGWLAGALLEPIVARSFDAKTASCQSTLSLKKLSEAKRVGSLDINAAPAYPLKIGANKRYLVDQNGIPFLWWGDMPWSLLVQLTKEEVEQYLENRRAKGFNSLIVNLIEHKFCDNPPRNRYGETPFTNGNDFTTPNEKYFSFVDWVINTAAEKGLQIVLAPAYLGWECGSEGWCRVIKANGPAKCREYGHYLGRRYKDLPNLIWLMGGDANPDSVEEHIAQLVSGIKEFDQTHLFTAQSAREHSAVDAYGEAWLDINTIYSRQNVIAETLRAYSGIAKRQPKNRGIRYWFSDAILYFQSTEPSPDSRDRVMPCYLHETAYEGEHDTTHLQLRAHAYAPVLCGAMGQNYGNRPLWLFDTAWQSAMDSAGARSMLYPKVLFASRAWYQLVPDRDHKVLTAGYGNVNDDFDYAPAARTENGNTMIVYLPTARKITIDMNKISGSQARAWWYEPTTGKATAIGEIPTTGSRDFTPPGSGDWVLVVDDASKNLPAPGAGVGELLA